MTTYMNVARYHLVQRFNYLILPWMVLAFAFFVDVVILGMTPSGHTSHRYVGGLGSILSSCSSWGRRVSPDRCPSGSRSESADVRYYVGTALLAVALAAISGVVITVGQAIERATDGWGISMAFFRVPYILDGPWYLTWLTSFVALTLLFVYGMWFGLVYRRWNLVGLVAFLAAPNHRAPRRGAGSDLDPRLARGRTVLLRRSAPPGSPACSPLWPSCSSWAASPPCGG